VLFALKRIGGGDVKLMAATALWAGADYGIDFLLLTALAGGVLSVGLLLRLNYGWVIGWPAVDTRKAVPYGVAIATGGMYVAAKLLISANQV
jgi:prepilin peptidase CpaA